MRFQYRYSEKAAAFFGRPTTELTDAQWLLVLQLTRLEQEPPDKPGQWQKVSPGEQ